MLFTVLLTVPASLFAQTAAVGPAQDANAGKPKFGYFSYNEVFKAMPEYADAQESLNMLQAKYDAEIKRADEEFNKKYAEFLQDQQNFPETILMRRQKELQQLMEKSIEFKNEIKELLRKAQQEMTAPVTAKMDEVLNAVGMAHDFDYILNTDQNAYPYINPLTGMDVTEEVKELLGIKGADQ